MDPLDPHNVVDRLLPVELTRSISGLFFDVVDKCESRVWSGVRGKYVGL